MNGCKNNCCQSWGISIDKPTYEKYSNLEDDLKKGIFQHLYHKEGQKLEVYIKLDSNGFCPFISEKGLCTLQLKFGYDFLSEICRVYPRVACNVGGSPEYFVELSCEAAVNHVLFDKTPLYFEEVELDIEAYKAKALNYNFFLDTSKYTKDQNGYDIFWKLRVASVTILHSRKYSVRFRMLLLCLFIQEVAELFVSEQDSKVIPVADEFLNKLNEDFYDELYASVPGGAEREFDIVLDVLMEVYNKQIMFRPAMDEVKRGFDMDLSSWTVSEGFNDKYSKYYDMYLAKNEYILENYLVYRVLSEGFPFNYRKENDIMSNYVELYAKFNLVEFLITGICRRYMKFDKRHICNIVSLFSRGYEHSISKFFQV